MSIKVSRPDGSPYPSSTSAVSQRDPRPIIWFDIDNCLYSKDAGVDDLMKDKIEKYFERIGIPKDEARILRHRYYTEYGLAIRGLVRHHKVDPLDYDAQCDAALPLENVLKPDLERRRLLNDIDRTKFRVWALTNAYVNHATRVLKMLDLAEFFEGVVSCDYTAPAGSFSCKPEATYFSEALAAANVLPSQCYFVDDSALNIKGAAALGWKHCVLFDEHGDQAERLKNGPSRNKIKEESAVVEKGEIVVIKNFNELRNVWKEIYA